MAIDEEILKATIVSLSNRASEKRKELDDINGIMNSLNNIAKRPYGDINGELPIDEGTGEIVTETRRDAVWATCKPKADAYL